MITYGNGEVLFNGSAQGFEMKYKGAITITNSPDNLFLSANKNKIVGIMLDGSDMPQELFNYVGELRVLSCKSAQNNSKGGAGSNGLVATPTSRDIKPIWLKGV